MGEKMDKKMFAVIALLALGLLIAGCAKSVQQEDSITPENDAATPENEEEISGNPDVYVDEQIIDENQEVEIGEMI